MQRVADFLKESGVFYIATVDGDQPHVRPFGIAHVFEGRIYIHTGAVKPVSKQMHANPKVEICAFNKGTTLRIAATVVLDERIEPQESLLAQAPGLAGQYKAGDGNNEVWYLKDAEATFAGPGGAEVVTF